MKNIKYIGTSLVLASILFTGCSGGDSASSTGSNSIAFPSNAVSAEPTLVNGEKVEKEVAKNQQSSYAINSVNDSSSHNIALTMKKISDVIANGTKQNQYSLNQTVNQYLSQKILKTIKHSPYKS